MVEKKLKNNNKKILIVCVLNTSRNLQIPTCNNKK